jgi:hypothetical protein
VIADNLEPDYLSLEITQSRIKLLFKEYNDPADPVIKFNVDLPEEV